MPDPTTAAEALEVASRQIVSSSHVEGQTVQLQDIDKLIRAKREAEADAAAANPTAAFVRQQRFVRHYD